MRFLIIVSLLLFGATAAAQVSSAGETLRYGGEARIGTEPPFRVHLELRFSGPSAEGEFTSEDGTNFHFSGEVSGSDVSGQFDGGGLSGSARLHMTSNRVDGTFDLGGQKGALDLRATTRGATEFLHPSQNIDLATPLWMEDLHELARILAHEHG